MADRYYAFTVALERDMRDDEAQSLMTAISQLRGVLRVEPLMASPETWMAEQRAIRVLGEKVVDAVYPQKAGAQ